MQQLIVTYTREHEDAEPTVVMQSVGFENDDLFVELLAAKAAYLQLKKRYAVRLESDQVPIDRIMTIMEML